MSEESDDLDRLAESIADGASINWDEVEKLPADARLRRLFAMLQMIDGVAEVHRSLGDPPHPSGSDPQDHTTPAPIEPAEAGEALGRWGHLVLRRKIGEGGFGEVYHAHDTWLDHPVALKLFKPRASGRNTTDRILHEARKLARIRHPNVVTVHGADNHDGRVGFWMDLVEGTTLERIVHTRRLSAGEATHIGQEVCRALAAVHRAGIIHRDIKAQNVMRASDDGRLILMDFGAGEFMANAADSPQQGTPVYLAPEIFDGSSASVCSDIYAVGVLLYFLVTGTFPVKGTSVPHLIDAHKRGERRRLRDGRPDLPAAFVSIVERALDPDPARRFSSAGEMEAALSGGSAEPLPIPHKTVERTVTQKLSIAAAGVVGAAAVVGWIACRVFDTSVDVHSDFTGNPLDYLAVGATALLPFVILWSVGAGALAVIASIGRALRKPLARVRGRLRASRSSSDGVTVATLVVVGGLSCWVAISWAYAEVFGVIGSLMSDAPASAAELALLGRAGQVLHRTHYLSSAYLSFLLALAIWRWFPWFEQDTADAPRVRLLKWAAIAVTALVIASGNSTRRLVWEDFEVVAFDNQRAFVIGSNSEELLLYYPYAAAQKHRRVRRDATTLVRTGAQARLFER
jgi:serine/threonine-protein kinase